MKLRKWLAVLGPGLITGASDDDPSGIATYSQVGAQFGFGMLWTMLFTFPLMAAIQEISAWIGRVSGRGIAANMRAHYPRLLLYGIVGSLFVANTLNLGADIGAMGSCMGLLLHGPTLVYTTAFALLSMGLEVFIPYNRYVVILKWLTLVLFSYFATAFLAHVPWAKALEQTVIPQIKHSKTFWTALIAVFGTTISPYLMFWQASEEAEEVALHDDQHPLKEHPEEAPAQHRRIRLDTYVGMAFSNVVAFFVILVAGATLHAHGVTEIQTAEQAAQALEPLAGRSAFLLFTIGILGTGLLAVPVLAGSAAYALGETLGWSIGLEKRPRDAKGFYGVIVFSTLLGLLLDFVKLNPIRALFWSAVLNGIVAVPVMAIIMLLTTKTEIMGEFTLPPYLKFMGWFATAVMLAAVVGLVLTWRN